jgi:hypothetical protein
VLCVLLAYASLCGLGFFVGVFATYWLVVRVCRRLNGAPFAVEDHVTILVGPHAGTVTRVYALTVGQGGDPLLRLDFGAEAASKWHDLFADYAVLRQFGDDAHGVSQTAPSNANVNAGSTR